MHTLKIPLPSWEVTQRPSCPVGTWHEGGHHHTKDVLLHLRRALCQKEVIEPRRDLAERSLNPDGTWLEGGHYHTKVVELKRSLEKRAVGGQIFMSGFTAGRSIYSYTVRVLLIQRRVLRHTERALCLGGIWQHYATQTVKLMNPDWLVQKYVLHETLQALNLTVVNSINHNFSKNIFLRI